MAEGRDEKGRFTYGHLFSLGNKGGVEPMYSDPDVMVEKIAEYLDWEDQFKGKEGKGTYTLEGCALYLGFKSVQSMYDYENRDAKFSYVVNRFRLFMTHWNVQKLYWGGTFAGSSYWLNNKADYSNEVTQNLKHTITEVKPEVVSTTPKIEESL